MVRKDIKLDLRSTLKTFPSLELSLILPKARRGRSEKLNTSFRASELSRSRPGSGSAADRMYPSITRPQAEMLINSNEKYQLQGISASIDSFDNHPMPVSRNAHLMPHEPVLT